MEPTSPTVARWELALRLRERRIQQGIDVKTIEQSLKFTRNYWSAVENNRRILTDENLSYVLDLFEFDMDERKELLELRNFAKQRGWWERYSAVCGAEMLRFIGFQEGAQSSSIYLSQLIPALLQTEEYMRALMIDDLEFMRQADLDQFVEVRLRRQERLTSPHPLHYSAVISAAALKQQVDGPDVQRTQLRYLARMIDERPDNIDVRIIPFSRAPGAVVIGTAFELLNFASAQLPPLAWYELPTAGGFVEDESRVHNLSIAFARAQRSALSRAESRELIASSIQEIG